LAAALCSGVAAVALARGQHVAKHLAAWLTG
jgi:hypothetical protein